MNVIVRLEYKLAYYDSTVHGFNHYTTRTPPKYFCEIKIIFAINQLQIRQSLHLWKRFFIVWFIAKIILISQEYFFWGYSKWCQIQFLVAEKSKQYEIYRRMCNVYRGIYFTSRIFTNELNIGLSLQTWV